MLSFLLLYPLASSFITMTFYCLFCTIVLYLCLLEKQLQYLEMLFLVLYSLLFLYSIIDATQKSLEQNVLTY